MTSDTSSGQDVGSRATLEELKAWRVEALRLADRAGAQAEDVRAQSTIYAKAAEELEKRVLAARADSKKLEAQGDSAGAEELEKSIVDLETLARRNFRIAEEKRSLGLTLDRDAENQAVTAHRLTTQIKERGGSSLDFLQI